MQFYPTCDDQQRNFFGENGFLVVHGAVATDDVAEVRAQCDVIVDKRHKLAFDWAWDKSTPIEARKFKIVQGSPSRIWPGINDTRLRGWMLGFASTLLGQPVEFWYDQYLAKPPREGRRCIGIRMKGIGGATWMSAALPAGYRCTTWMLPTVACTSSKADIAMVYWNIFSLRTFRVTFFIVDRTTHAPWRARLHSVA